MAILSRADNFELHISLKLSFTNIQGLCSNFVDCESVLGSNAPDILALCETNLNGSIDFGADWDSLCDQLRDVPWEDIFRLSASGAAGEFCEWVQVGIDVYIPHRKYQVKPHSSPWSSDACAATIVHRNNFFHLYQKDKSEVKFRQGSNRCKRFLKLPNLHMLMRQKNPSLARNLALRTFGELPVVLSTKVNLLYLLFSGLEVFSSASDEAKVFSENCSKNSNLDDSGISLPVFPTRTNLKLHNISVNSQHGQKRS